MGIQDAIRNHPSFGGLLTGAVLGAGGISVINIVRRRIKRRSLKRISKSRRKKSVRKKPTKRKKSTRKTSRKGSKKIRLTKNGQPFIILPDGRARFISKKSARIRRKRKGGFS